MIKAHVGWILYFFQRIKIEILFDSIHPVEFDDVQIVRKEEEINLKYISLA